MSGLPQPVQSWGRLRRDPHFVQPLLDSRHSLPASSRPALPYGNGRSYGDACLNPGGTLWMLRGLDRFIAFDKATGVIECEAGVLLREIIDVAMPQGWFLPVTPGTQYATLGGAIANDVHGKNHHGAGSLGEHVLSLWLARTDGSLRCCSPREEPQWFAATVAGLGLTGVITRVRLQLRRVPGPWIRTQTTSFETLGRFFELSSQAETGSEYNVAWVDCAGGRRGQVRGVFFAGDHAAGGPPPSARVKSVPFTPPVSLINGLSLRAFNLAYYHGHRLRNGPGMQHYTAYFYPLDHVLHWNRLYGPRGFYQYQCVVPLSVQAPATAALLSAIRDSGTGSFLAVLKTFGERPGVGMLSFPMAGTTLALDFPNLGSATQRLFERLDAIVAEAGGRLYAAKDACMSRDMFERGYPRATEFQRWRDPGISSAMSRRLMGT